MLNLDYPLQECNDPSGVQWHRDIKLSFETFKINLFDIYNATLFTISFNPLSVAAYLPIPTCEDGLVHPEGGGEDLEQADVGGDLVTHWNIQTGTINNMAKM